MSDEKSDLEKVSWTRILLSYISIFSGCDHWMLWSLLGKECNNEGSKKQHQNSPQLLVFKQLLLASIREHMKAFCLALSRPVLEGFVLSLLSFLWVLLLKAFCWHNLFFFPKKEILLSTICSGLFCIYTITLLCKCKSQCSRSGNQRRFSCVSCGS